jgi:hypothetical protein
MKKLLAVAVACVIIIPAAVGVLYFSSLREQGREGTATPTAGRQPVRTAEDLRGCVRLHLRDYRVEVIHPKDTWGRDLTLRVFDGGMLVGAWEVHPNTVFTRLGDVLYLADYHPIASGCAVVAYDLKARRPLWRTHLQGIGPVKHSKYRNRVRIETDGRMLIVRGDESSGRYVEVLDVKSGRTVEIHRFDRD